MRQGTIHTPSFQLTASTIITYPLVRLGTTYTLYILFYWGKYY